MDAVPTVHYFNHLSNVFVSSGVTRGCKEDIIGFSLVAVLSERLRASVYGGMRRLSFSSVISPGE